MLMWQMVVMAAWQMHAMALRCKAFKKMSRRLRALLWRKVLANPDLVAAMVYTPVITYTRTGDRGSCDCYWLRSPSALLSSLLDNDPNP